MCDSCWCGRDFHWVFMEDDWNPPSPPTSRTSWAQQWWALGVARVLWHNLNGYLVLARRRGQRWSKGKSWKTHGKKLCENKSNDDAFGVVVSDDWSKDRSSLQNWKWRRRDFLTWPPHLHRTISESGAAPILDLADLFCTVKVATNNFPPITYRWWTKSGYITSYSYYTIYLNKG